MADQEGFPWAKLFIGVILGPRATVEEVVTILGGTIGPAKLVAGPIPFDYTDYYDAEMGSPLRRAFVTIAGLWDPSRLAEAKIATNRLEAAGAEGTTGAAPTPGRCRRFNLDPGLLSLHSLILASTKPHAHRIPLHSGIYAEVTLIFRNGAFRSLPWTYPDYASPAYQEILIGIRNDLRDELKQQENDNRL